MFAVLNQISYLQEFDVNFDPDKSQNFSKNDELIQPEVIGFLVMICSVDSLISDKNFANAANGLDTIISYNDQPIYSTLQDFQYIPENGTLISKSLTDAGYLYAFSDSDYEGWSICTAGKISDILGPVKTATLFTGISLLVLTFCALALGILLNRKKALEAREKEAHARELLARTELESLCEKINPHFLYNSLENISGMAFGSKPELVADTCDALGRLLRYSTRGSDNVTLDDELSYARNFFFVMAQRYNGNLTFIEQCSDEARAARVPKMLLQPLIENALKHGKLNLYPDGNVTINASFTDDRCLCIEVTNNGKLIEPEKCNELNILFNDKKSITSNTNHIGLATTCIRWMIMFGESATFSISRTENTTSVTMKGNVSQTL